MITKQTNKLTNSEKKQSIVLYVKQKKIHRKLLRLTIANIQNEKKIPKNPPPTVPVQKPIKTNLIKTWMKILTGKSERKKNGKKEKGKHA